jgi:DNA topoisomerase-1
MGMTKGWHYESWRHSLAARGIKVPPAWKHVKHYTDKPYVATGIDKKGRIQYIYPASFIKKETDKKFNRINRLEKQMPKILSRIKSDVDSQKPEAEAVYTIYRTGFRPGTERDTLADKQAYGVSTLEPKHIKISGNNVRFKFVGKKGVSIQKEVNDKLLAKIMRRRKENNEKQLFPVSDDEIRSYFNRITNNRYKLKDLRTLRAQRLARRLDGDKKQISMEVSKELCNTPAVAIKSYVSPELIDV